MKILKLSYSLIGLIALTASMCGGPSDSDKTPTKSTLKIVLVDSLSVDNEEDERHLSEDIIKLCDVVVSDNKDCNYIVILDPTLTRLDLGKDLSLKTTIEKGGSKDISNPKVISKLIKKNLEAINIPKDFTKPSTGKELNQAISTFISIKATNDSVLVLSTDGSLSEYLLNNRKTKLLTSIEDVRNQITAILCEKQKTNFTLLINPPVSINKPTPILSPSAKRPRRNAKVANSTSRRKVSLGNGDLTIIKGSEGCDICTRYYSARDNIGRVRQVTQRSSTECCPCGKTIEMRGRTYRMECDGYGGNKLALVE